MNREQLIKRLRDLPYPTKEYWLVAGGAMVLHGIKEETRDIDLGCSKGLADLLEAEGYRVHRMADGSRKIEYDCDIELFEEWRFDRVETIDGIPVISLRGLIMMKKALGREKDLEDIAKITDYLRHL